LRQLAVPVTSTPITSTLKATQTASRITPLAQIPADRDVKDTVFSFYKL
jgi:hypothetical protein